MMACADPNLMSVWVILRHWARNVHETNGAPATAPAMGLFFCLDFRADLFKTFDQMAPTAR